MQKRGTLTDIWDLRVGDLVAPMGYNDLVIEVVSIRRTGTKRFTWHITWKHDNPNTQFSQKTKHSANSQLNVIGRAE